MISIMEQVLKSVKINFNYLWEFLDTLDKFVMFGLLDLNAQILKVV